LHKKGYTAFTMPQLTPLEINFLIEGHNKNEKAKKRAQDKAMKKMKFKKPRRR